MSDPSLSSPLVEQSKPKKEEAKKQIDDFDVIIVGTSLTESILAAYSLEFINLFHLFIFIFSSTLHSTIQIFKYSNIIQIFTEHYRNVGDMCCMWTTASSTAECQSLSPSNKSNYYQRFQLKRLHRQILNHQVWLCFNMTIFVLFFTFPEQQILLILSFRKESSLKTWFVFFFMNFCLFFKQNQTFSPEDFTFPSNIERKYAIDILPRLFYRFELIVLFL